MSERVVWRPYLDYEREERWLNEMAAKGLEMKRYTWCRYVFEEGEPGRYVYRIQLLQKPASAPESTEYLRFLEDTGAEIVDTYLSWVYVRKATDGEPFELFSDRGSRIAHHRRAASLAASLAAAQIPLFTVGASSWLHSDTPHGAWSWPFLLPSLALIVLTGGVALRHYRRLQLLRAESVAHE